MSRSSWTGESGTSDNFLCADLVSAAESASAVGSVSFIAIVAAVKKVI